MANQVFLSKTTLTGGGATALDSIDGAGLVDGDFALVTVAGVSYLYKLDADSAAGETSPSIIAPDTNGGDKRWLLQGSWLTLVEHNATGTHKALNVSPTRPAFLVVPTVEQSNIATSGVTVVWGTEVFDQGNNFAANIFTAPVTGKYLFCFSLILQAVDTAAAYYACNLVTSNKTFTNYSAPLFTADPANLLITFSVVCDMDLNDTALVSVNQSDGANQTDIREMSAFSGCLLC